MEKDIYRIFDQPEFHEPSLIICWDEDTAAVGPIVVETLTAISECRAFADIDPTDFFVMEGVEIENDVARFPESTFFYCEQKNLILLESSKPRMERYKYLTAVLDVAQHYCKVKDIFVIHAIAAQMAHNAPRRILSVFNDEDFQKQLRGDGLESMKYEGFPAINSYLLWLAKEREIPAMSLWPEVPLYLAASDDPAAAKTVLSFLDRRFELGLDFAELDAEIEVQDQQITELRGADSEVDDWIRSLESGMQIGRTEQGELLNRITQHLQQNNPA